MSSNPLVKTIKPRLTTEQTAKKLFTTKVPRRKVAYLPMLNTVAYVKTTCDKHVKGYKFEDMNEKCHYKLVSSTYHDRVQIRSISDNG